MTEPNPAQATPVTLPDGVGAPGHAIVVMGAPGAGKSTVGALLARQLGCSFVDVDAEIERRAGKPISEIFIDEGEAWFRALERETTVELLGHGGVVSLGGGAVTSPDIRAALAGHEVVWLKVSITQATRRVGMNQMRPLLLGNVRSRLVALLQERTPLYEACATMTVDTDHQKAKAVAREVVARLSGVQPDVETQPDAEAQPDGPDAGPGSGAQPSTSQAPPRRPSSEETP